MSTKQGTSAPKLIAFWRYDIFPYVLSGTVESVNTKGHVLTKEYGPGLRFNPLCVLPAAAGEPIAAKLKTLEKERRAAVDSVHGD
ncbi:MAG: hypothetical protein ABI574_19285, partial [Burkholderiales bacterium]